MSALLLLTPLSMGWAQRPTGSTQNALAGSWVFGAKGCANCHAINGVGKTVGPDLGRGELRSYSDLAAAFWNHYPRMAARMREQGIQPPRIGSDDMGDLIAFLTSVNYFDPPGNAERGKTSFARKQCVRCHQFGGAGGVVGPDLDQLKQVGSPIDIAAALWNHGPAMSQAMTARGISRPSFTAAELVDLLAYLRAATPGLADRPLQLFPGRPDSGRRWFWEKGCAGCHSIRGQGGGHAPDLALRERPLSLFQFAATLWNKLPAMLQVMRSQGIAVPQLDAGQMADLVAYLSDVQYFRPPGNAAAGRAVIETRGCLGCHSLDRRGASTGGDLAKARGLDSPAAVSAAMWNHGRLAPTTAAGLARWPRLTAPEVTDIATYFVSRGATR